MREDGRGAIQVRKSTRVTRKLGIDYPILQGPFAGVPSHRLAAIVSNKGGLGAIGAHGLEGLAIREAVDQVRSQTNRPFAVNLWVSTSDPGIARIDSEATSSYISALATYYAELGTEPPSSLQFKVQDFGCQFRAAIDARVPVLSFTFGPPPAEMLDECRKFAIPTIGTATTPDEARVLEQAGLDLVIASGTEAGGHRGSFLVPSGDSLIGTFSLLPQVVDAVKIPVIAAGGVADGRGITAAFALGAEAVLIGSAFLACVESGASEAHRSALLSISAQGTGLTSTLTGRMARAVKNRIMSETTATISTPLPYPAQHALIRTVTDPASLQQRADLMPLWAGQSSGLIRSTEAAALMTDLIGNIHAPLSRSST